ncbi:TPA: ATP-binding protein, partial [Clostridioides difficile]|nr:ATP-binding protein [Clostridioides difficile]
MKARKAIEKIKAKHDLRSAVKEALDTLPSAVCYFTPAGTVKLCNTAMYELYRKITQSDLQSLTELNEALEGCDNTTGVIRDGNVFLFP